MRLHFVAAICVVGMAILSGGAAWAQQEYPNRILRLYTSEPGGGTDFLSRIIAQGISGPLGQSVIVENRGGNIALLAETVARNPPDGYNLLVWANGVWVAPLMEKVNYDPLRDLAPVTLAVIQPSMLVVHPSLPVKSVKDLIALAKSRPGELNYASSGNGGTTHLHAELLKSLAGINLVRVNYKSTGSGLNANISGEVQVMFPTANAATPHVKSGRLRALAVTTAKPSPLLPGLPTVAETLPAYEAVTMTGVFAAGKPPAAVINRLNQEIVRLLNQADVKQKFFNAGVDIVASTPDQLADTMKTDAARWAKVIKDAGIRSE